MVDDTDQATMERSTIRIGIAVAMVLVGAAQAALALPGNVPYGALGVFYALLGVAYYLAEVHRDADDG